MIGSVLVALTAVVIRRRTSSCQFRTRHELSYTTHMLHNECKIGYDTERDRDSSIASEERREKLGKKECGRD